MTPDTASPAPGTEPAAEPAPIVRAMARTMIDIASVRGSCDAADLAAAGYAVAEILEYEGEARQLAERLAVRDLHEAA